MMHGSERAEHDDARAWDRFYAGDGNDAVHWSGQPNPTLVTGTATLPPGRALDVGCGEGADAIWLARHGWQVTAIDPSIVALRRARTADHAAGVEVAWIRAGLLEFVDDHGTYDLVSAHYPVLRREVGDPALAALLRVVAPGGTLLFVHHELDRTRATDHGFDPSDHLMPEGIAAALDDDWHVQAIETRQHDRGLKTAHPSPRDIVLRARRREGRA
jgi:SAM-dependent methyltransferase